MSNDICHYGMPILSAVWPKGDLFALGGGGGSAKNGIQNRVILVKYEHDHLSDPLSEVDFGDEFPFRFALHPKAMDLVVGLGGKSAKHVKIQRSEKASKEITGLAGVEEGPAFEKFKEISEVISSIVFSRDGTLLCLGYEKGWIQVFEWPEMKQKVRCREDVDFSSLNDIDISPDGQIIATTSDMGVCELWGIEDGKHLNTISRPTLRSSRYAHAKFAPIGRTRMYATANTDKSGGFLFKWSVKDNCKLSMMCKRKVAPEAISSLAISDRGDMLAVGMNSGDLLVVSGGGMYPLQRIKGAHMVFVTALTFEKEDLEDAPTNTLNLLSASADHSARVSRIKRKSEFSARLSASTWIIAILLVLLAVLLIQLDKHLVTSSPQPEL